MKKLVIVVAAALFIIPFFWYPKGSIDLTGDSYRVYFLDPVSVMKNLSLYAVSPSATNAIDPFFYTIPYLFIISLLHTVLRDPWAVIAVTDGFRLTMTFLSFYLLTRKLLVAADTKKKDVVDGVSLIGAVLYVSLITARGWGASLFSFNHIFLHPLILYLLLLYLLDHNILAAYGILILSFIFSLNFNLTSAPQFFSFFPLAIAFTFLYVTLVLQRRMVWSEIFIGFIVFVGIHAFHLLPQVMTLFNKTSYAGQRLFDQTNITHMGVDFFETNRHEFGKISSNLFQPYAERFHNISLFIIPAISVLGLMKKRSKMLALLGVFFAITLFLVSANVTYVGVTLYKQLFYIPGFMMFRAFYDKWYFVFAFFYALLCIVSYYYLVKDKKPSVNLLLGLCIIAVFIYRVLPFILGETVRTHHYQSHNVSTFFEIDPDLITSLSYLKNLPQDGKVLTLPLTFPYFQIAYGKQGGAFVGISTVSLVAGKPDFTGFWTFGPYERLIFDVLRREDIDRFVQLLSLLNVRYIFRNSDSRIIDDFPGYPYVYPGMTYSSKEQLPIIKDQNSYEKFLALLPVKKIYAQGFYEIYEFEDAVVRPHIYIPDSIYSDQQEALKDSYRSAYVDDAACDYLTCDGNDSESPSLSYRKRSPVRFEVDIDMRGRKTPFLLILSNDFHSTWDFSLEPAWQGVTINHILVNGYANGWIIDPEGIQADVVHGTIYLKSQNYLYIGIVISGAVFLFVVVRGVRIVTNKRHEEK